MSKNIFLKIAAVQTIWILGLVQPLLPHHLQSHWLGILSWSIIWITSALVFPQYFKDKIIHVLFWFWGCLPYFLILKYSWRYTWDIYSFYLNLILFPLLGIGVYFLLKLYEVSILTQARILTSILFIYLFPARAFGKAILGSLEYHPFVSASIIAVLITISLLSAPKINSILGKKR